MKCLSNGDTSTGSRSGGGAEDEEPDDDDEATTETTVGACWKHAVGSKKASGLRSAGNSEVRRNEQRDLPACTPIKNKNELL